jgi:long-chain acyl-CoA synthetase
MPEGATAGATLGAALRAVGERHADRAAVIDGGRSHTYAWLLEATGRMARRLAAARVRRLDRVALVLPNGPEFVCAFFATAGLGAAAVPLNPALEEAEAAAVLASCGVSALISGPAQRQRSAGALARAGLAAPVLEVSAPDGDGGSHARAGLGCDGIGARAADPVLYLHSSGSTGRPKRVARTHENLPFEVERLTVALGLSPRDRVLGAAPFSHVNGLVRSMLASVLSGAALVTVGEFERHAVGRLIAGERVSVFVGVPAMFGALAETRWPEAVDLSSLRLCLSASAPLPARVARRFRERYGAPLGQIYGTTETGTVTVSRQPIEAEPPGSVGVPLPGVTVEVRGEDAALLPPGGVGHIAIGSPAAATGYDGGPGDGGSAFAGGFFVPGDLGWTDGDGRLYLAGRTSLFINRGGYKVDPWEVEELLEQHPKVREAAVIGVEAPLGDQHVKAVLVCSDPCEAREIIDFCRGRIAPFKIPSIVEFRSEIPRSATGKVLRRRL